MAAPRLALAVLAGALALAPVPARAQSIVTGDILGRVVDAEGAPLQGALVTLRQAEGTEGRPGQVATSDQEGRFTFPFLLPGRYQILAEALGRRPVLVEALRVEPGRASRIDVPLAVATPPVERRDTLHHAGLPEATGAALAWADPDVIRALPDRTRDLSYLASLSSQTDGDLGFEGLPERFTRLYADGQPFAPARLPGSSGDPGKGLLFPASSIAHAAAFPGTSDVEWKGGPGGYLALSTGVHRPGVPEVYGLWSADPLWSAGAFPGPVPGFNSVWGGVGTSLDLVPDTAVLHVAVETSRVRRPVAPLLSDSVATLLFPPEEGTTSPLAQPVLEDATATSGSARLDWNLGERGTLEAGVEGAAFSLDRGPLPSPDARYLGPAPSTDGVDGAATANLIVKLTELLALEIRGGGSFSRRDYSAFLDSTAVGQGSTLLLDPAVVLGHTPGVSGKVRRTEVGASAILHLTTGPHRLKAGLRASQASYRYEGGRSGDTFLFGDAASVGTTGLAVGALGTAPQTSFGVDDLAGFVQYRWNPVPAVVFTAGVRYDVERLPTDQIRPDAEWAARTGLQNNDVQKMPATVGALLHGSWDITGKNRTVLEGGVSVENGEVDPAALQEVILNTGRMDVGRTLGELASWPSSPASFAFQGASLSLFGPDLVPPRTTHGVLGFAHRFGDATTLRIAGSIRQTQFLLRRADLNRPVSPSTTTADGRPVLAPLVADGGLVEPDLSTWRRFPAYDAVWALNADGWSRYRGLTVGLEQSLPADGTFFVNYTYSETTDNLFGLRSPEPGARLSPGLPDVAGTPWDEGVSDLDVPHRLAVGAVVKTSHATLTGVFRVRSGLPFTPMVRGGLDVNGDGSWLNDVAFVPDVDAVRELAGTWSCLDQALGGFPERNSCRGDFVKTLDLRAALGPFHLGSVPVEVVVDALNVTDQAEGIRDNALVGLEPGAALDTDAGGHLVIPYRVNPGFGSLLLRTDPGRLVRLGVRVGAP